MDVALGFRTHSGWAAVVAVGLSYKRPVVCDRRLVVLADSEIPGSKQPFHTAEPMPLPKAKEFLKRCTASANLLAAEAVRDCVAKLKNDGNKVHACGLLSGAGRVPDSVEAILASHAAIHAAEGELYRSAIEHACEICNLPLARVPQKDAIGFVSKALHLEDKKIRDMIAAIGKQAGPPWSEDQKLATLAAWIALAATKSRTAEAV